MSTPLDAPGVSPRSSRLERLVLLLMLLAVAAASLFLLLQSPNGLLKRNLPATDLPWQGSGIKQLIVNADGTWKISRSGYADRQRRLEISPSGALTAYHDDSLLGGLDDASGGFDVPRATLLGTTISIKPPEAYYQWKRNLRTGADHRLLNPLPDPASDAAGRPGAQALLQEYVPVVQTKGHPTDVVFPPPPDTGVVVWLNPLNKMAFLSLLPGHWYFYDVSDCAAYKDGKLWLTMDRQRNLYRLRIDEPKNDPPAITVEAAARLALPGVSDGAGRLGMDPQRQQLFLVRPDGTRYWFDPETLAQTATDHLPGNWQPEVATWDLRPGPYNPYLGTPLSQLTYDRILRAAMVVFLASLLGLVMLWRPPWKSISAQTTAGSNSSADSENT